MNNLIRSTYILLFPLATGSALSQTVTMSTVRNFCYATDSQGYTNDDWVIAGDPGIAPHSYDMFVELIEPIQGPGGAQAYHRAGNRGQVESIGSVWTGSNSYWVEYPDSLEVGADVTDPDVHTGPVAQTNHYVWFTLDHPMEVEVDATFRTDLIEPYGIGNLEGFDISIYQKTDLLFSTGFDAYASGVDQTYSGSLLLEPGDYVMWAVGALRAKENFGYRSASASYEYSVTFVPAPASAATLLAAGFLFRRSRTG